MIKTYIAHYSKLSDRKLNVDKLIARANIDNYEFVTNEPNKDFIKQFYSNSADLWYDRVRHFNYGGPIHYRQLSKAEISLLYKHYLIFKDITQNENEFCLVLEDDVVFNESFLNDLNSILNEAPKDWDFIFLGSGCDLRIPKSLIRPNQKCYLKSHPAAKCTDSFLVKKESLQKILSTLMPFILPIDFELNYHMWAHDMNVYWIEPPLIRQGSQDGTFKSLIN